MDAKKELLILETQEKDAEGNNVYLLLVPSSHIHGLHLVWIKEFL
jgi:hypothetical protein